MQTMPRPTHPEPQPLGPKKTLFVMIIVVGCIAILWPKVFYPAMTGNPQKPSVMKDHRGTGIRQERPPHLRPDGIHPAMRERGRAIPIIPSVPITGDRPHRVPPIPPKIIDGRPPPIPGMRPPMGAGSHQQPANRNNSMGFIMPLYTIGIVAFFIYTIMKLVCKRSTAAPYNEVKPDPKFREQVFEAETEPTYIKRPDDGTTKLGCIYHHSSHLVQQNGHYQHDFHDYPLPPPNYELPLDALEPLQDTLPLPPLPPPPLDEELTIINDDADELVGTSNNQSDDEKQVKTQKDVEEDERIEQELLKAAQDKKQLEEALKAQKKVEEEILRAKIKKELEEKEALRVKERIGKIEAKMHEPKIEIVQAESSRGGTPIKLKITKLEMEYQQKEKQQLMEIELLRKKLEETERAMANIISRMDSIPGQKKDTTTNEEQQDKPDIEQNDQRIEEVKEEDSKKGKIEVLGIEVTATCEGGKKWSRPSSPFLMPHVGHKHHVDEVEREELDPIVLDTPVVPESQILVTDTDTVAEEFIDDALNGSPEDPAVILSGRMTLSLISPHLPHAEKHERFEDSSDEIISNGKEMHVEVDNVVLMERLLQQNSEDEHE